MSDVAPLDATPCRRCGGSHARCSAHRRDGSPCTMWPMRGQRVCKMHGGKTPGGLAGGRAAIEQARTLAAIGRLNLDHPPNVEPVDAAEAELRRTSALVSWLDRVVTAEDAPDLVTSAWSERWLVERKHLLAVSKALMDANVDERRVRLAEQTGEHLAGVLERFAAELLDVVLRSAIDQASARIVRELWATAVGEIGQRQLLAAIEPAPTAKD